MTDLKAVNTTRPPRTKKPRRFWSFRRVLLLLVLLVAVLAGVAAIVPTRRWIECDGILITKDEAEIRPRVEGTIEKWLKKHGDKVTKGEIVVQLRDSLQQAAYVQAKKELLVAHAQLKHLTESQVIQLAEQKEKINRARLNVKMIAKELQTMIDCGPSFSKQELANTRLRLDVAISQLEELRIPKQKALDLKIKVLQEQKAVVESKMQLCETQIELKKIRAPLDGIIWFNDFEPGEVVKPEHVLGHMFNTDEWIVKLQLPESEIAYVQNEQSIEVELIAYPWWKHGYITATVSDVLRVVTPRATGDGIFYAEGLLENPSDQRLNPGMKIRASIDAGQTNWLSRLMGW